MNARILNNRFLKAAMAMSAVALLACQTSVYAADSTPAGTSDIKTKVISNVRHVANYYNAFGVCYSSTETTTTKTQTTSTKAGETTPTTSTDTTVSTVTQVWKGGSLKVDTVTGTTDREGTDGSKSHSDFTTTYSYDDQGRLQGATGTSATTGDLAKDKDGNPGGKFSSTTTDTYIIKNGQALRSQSVTTSTTTLDGQTKSTSTETTAYEYELCGGNYHVMKEVSTSNTQMSDGSSESTTKTKTYTRDANGVITDIDQTGSGTYVDRSNGGNNTFTMKNYDAEFTQDPIQGWYMEHETYDWAYDGGTPAAQGGDSSAAAGGGSDSEGAVDSAGNAQMPVLQTSGSTGDVQNQGLNLLIPPQFEEYIPPQFKEYIPPQFEEYIPPQFKEYVGKPFN